MEDFTYVPVLRFREQERKALKSVNMSNKMVPLIEMVSEKPRSNSKEDSIQHLINETDGMEQIFIDIPIYLSVKRNTKESTIDFINRMKSDVNQRIGYYLDDRLVGEDRFIPVISYDPAIPFNETSLKQLEFSLRERYGRLGFRIYPTYFQEAFTSIKDLLQKQDFLFFDVGEGNHNTQNKRFHESLVKLASTKDATSIIIRSAVPKELTYTGLTNNEVVGSIDNSLLKDYTHFGYDAFGDYAGVKKDDITEGGRISPGYFLFSGEYNLFYGFKGEFNRPATFTSLLVPEIMDSKVWKTLSKNHKENCYGCRSIIEISENQRSGNAQSEWKGYTMAHYLYTLEEFL
ncbi:beta family protein [Salicibibacter halophilus]|uniref:beta family protein n=1 Tax=Salicibibacter halophilus TaxID=2502791 RepID=UPI001357693B|nr:hypothetical protein [Salicibibacter halophilus]